MTGYATAALIFCALATFLHVLTAILAAWKIRTAKLTLPLSALDPVTVIRPVCGLDYYDHLTLRSTFELDYPDYEIIFCCARHNDPAVPVLRALMSEYPYVRARLLIGDDRPTANPKLNNLLKGWSAARTDWVALADSNVLMPRDYIQSLMQRFDAKAGLVCSPPIGSRPHGFSAELECAFLNTYQARWQCAAAAIGFGFAQGKSMLWRRADLDGAGGIQALAIEIAEDAAATKIVRGLGLHVRVVPRPYEQPLGPRRAKQVWDRQLRWARLRRATFPAYYLPEILTGSFFPMLAAASAANALDYDPLLAVGFFSTLWFGTEALLAKAAGWHFSLVSPLAWFVRDLAIPVLWLEGLAGDDFNWRGNDMKATDRWVAPLNKA